ncbi:hypothetical protein JAAARDRAFT_613464 [Jaapia argillacea MUCL 33604]|uniref:Uncharacterized protein n=1 Tax=Jaapia argillacea MUCL 33604 TaxID=933084 RepID=A0A067P4W0_9AGAM|nr:hypothetical protein JAAARDRAFT_613464 [Jaapia argillacea MUCL 33604]
MTSPRAEIYKGKQRRLASQSTQSVLPPAVFPPGVSRSPHASSPQGLPDTRTSGVHERENL